MRNPEISDVRPGETILLYEVHENLDKISNKFNVSVEDIFRVNPCLRNNRLLILGTTIWVPVKPDSTWYDHAVTERVRRVEAETKLKGLIEKVSSILSDFKRR